jgi:hypothetical protein
MHRIKKFMSKYLEISASYIGYYKFRWQTILRNNSRAAGSVPQSRTTLMSSLESNNSITGKQVESNRETPTLVISSSQVNHHFNQSLSSSRSRKLHIDFNFYFVLNLIYLKSIKDCSLVLQRWKPSKPNVTAIYIPTAVRQFFSSTGVVRVDMQAKCDNE